MQGPMVRYDILDSTFDVFWSTVYESGSVFEILKVESTRLYFS